jgi:hypothetical protein
MNIQGISGEPVKMIRNEKGIALVTTLMLMLIGLGLTLCLLNMITEGAKMSGTNKRYKTTLEASYGGAEILVKDIVPYMLQNIDLDSSSLLDKLNSAYLAILPEVADINCLKAKITTGTTSWSTSCGATAIGPLTPANSPDITLNLQGTNNNTFLVYAKIVSTKTGNTSMSGLTLEGSSTSETPSTITPQHSPYLYTIETQGKRTGDISATAHIEVLYAY